DEDEGDSGGEAPRIEPAADEARVAVEAPVRERVQASCARHPPGEADDHRREAERADARGEVDERDGRAGEAGGAARGQRARHDEGEQGQREAERLTQAENAAAEGSDAAERFEHLSLLLFDAAN